MSDDPILDALREARDGAREAAKAARNLQGMPAALERVAGLAQSLQGLANNAATIRDATKDAQQAADAARSAVESLHDLRGTIASSKVLLALLGLLVAFGGGFTVGHWYTKPGLWPLGLHQQGACEQAGGVWSQSGNSQFACVFWQR
jgi:hypothetical protein